MRMTRMLEICSALTVRLVVEERFGVRLHVKGLCAVRLHVKDFG